MANDKFPWMTSIHVNEVRHLKDLQIDICSDAEMRHLILTGPNGSGKTSLLTALLEHLIAMTEDPSLNFENLKANLQFWQSRLSSIRANVQPHEYQAAKQQVVHLQSQFKRYWGAVHPKYTDESAIPLLFAERKFVIAYYNDFRQSRFIAPVNPEKPNLNYIIRDSKVKEFLKFLVDLKVQQALARNEGQMEDADSIDEWFETFIDILKVLFHDPKLVLNFNYKDYSFRIVTGGKTFPFTGLSAGYSAALEIVADLIIKMQLHNRFVRAFDMPGIALIDEIETHLHLSLQKEILPILIRIFPNIQFIVTTHSPFVLNSIKNATVYDLVSHETIQDLTEYSYESLTEGFFGVDTESGELKRRLDRIESILKAGVDESSRIELENLLSDFERVPDSLAPAQKARYNELNRQYLSEGAR